MQYVEPNEYGDIRFADLGTIWRLERHGEQVLWGEGHLGIDLIGEQHGAAEGYALRVEEDVTPAYDDLEAHEFYALVDADAVGPDGGVDLRPEFVVGLAFGSVKRKMIPAACPDVTAVRLGADEEFEPIAQPAP